MLRKSILLYFITCLLLIILFKSSFAQSFLFHSLPKEKSQFSLRFIRPIIESEKDLSILSGVYDFSVNIPLSKTLNLAGSIPYITAHVGNKDPFNGIGNIYIGLQIHSSLNDKNVSVGSFGLFLPTADEDRDIGSFGIFTNFYDFHKYLSDLLTIYGNYSYYNIFSQGIKLGVEIGPNLLIPTNGKGIDTQLIMHYGVTVGFQYDIFAIQSEFVGLVSVTEDIEDFSDRFTHAIDFGAIYISDNFIPGIFYKLYFKEILKRIVDGVFGLKFDYLLN